MTSNRTRDEWRWKNTALQGIHAVGPSSVGVLEKVGAFDFAIRAIGTGLSADIPTFGDVSSGALRSVRTITASGAALSTDYTILVDASGGAVTVTLPAVSASSGLFLTTKAIDISGGVVTIDGAGAETIDGATTQVISAQYDSLTIHCDGTEWWII